MEWRGPVPDQPCSADGCHRAFCGHGPAENETPRLTWYEVSLWLDARGLEAQDAGQDDLATAAFRLAVYAIEQPRTTVDDGDDALCPFCKAGRLIPIGPNEARCTNQANHGRKNVERGA